MNYLILTGEEHRDRVPERFYIFMPEGDGSALMKYFDEKGKPWNVMEDDDNTAECAVAFLMRSGAKVFSDDHESLK